MTGDAGRGAARWARILLVLAPLAVFVWADRTDRLTGLEKLPFQQKIRELNRYLDEARKKASRS